MDLAASLQALTEEIYFALLNYLYKVTKSQNICLAGGVALNSSANGKIFEKTPFKEIFIQPAASDDGGAIGAAFYLWNHILNQKRSFIMEHAYWGPKYSEDEIELALNKNNLNYVKLKDEELLPKVAKDIADGKIVGWFQGRMEFGPRALGNRSIVVDPRRKEMKDILNERIKRREWFRPFAPSILEEEVDKWFEINYPEPFMIKTYKWKEEKRHLVPAVVHEDGTGRLQTVSKKTNPRYWQLIKEFQNLTGIPVVLNTSFNENEPIVNKPEEAIDCFLRTKMDVLVLENFYVSR
jgi:carbamoyltransferase